MNRNNEPVAEDEVQDDAVIGVAFRRSLIAAAVVGAIVTALVFVGRRTPPPEVVEEAELAAPLTSAEASVATAPGVAFTDITAQAGITFTHVNGAYGERLLPETMGSGVAFFDMDDDGDQDLFFVNAAPWPWRTDQAATATSALYRNAGDGRFEEVTAGSGLDVSMYGTGVAVADYNGDGLPDVFVSAVGLNRLFRNLGNGRFEPVADGPAGEDDAWSTSAAFLDYDRDGDLDLFVANYVRWSRDIDLEVDYRMAGIGRAYGPPTNYEGAHSYLYRNDDGVFTDVSAEAGIRVDNPSTGLAMGKALAVRPVDADADGWPDIAVANDTVGNFLFLNTRDGRFDEAGALSGIAYDSAGSATGAMGIDAARFNNDGDIGIAVGNFANEMTSFYVAQADSGVFSDESIVCGIGPASRRALSFGLFFFDYDLDGRQDLLQANGHVEDEINLVQPSQQHEQAAQLFWNCGAGCPRNFIPAASETIGDLARPLVGRGAAYADIDGDGDVDVALTQPGRAAVLLRNDQALGHHWIRVRLVGEGNNTDAIGAEVTLTAGGQRQRRVVMPSRSYLSQVETTLTFGLAGQDGAERLDVRWPDGTFSSLENLAADRSYRVVQGAVTGDATATKDRVGQSGRSL